MGKDVGIARGAWRHGLPFYGIMLATKNHRARSGAGGVRQEKASMSDKNSTTDLIPTDDRILVLFHAARNALEQARTIDEVKDVRDKAEALRLYVKQCGESLEMQNAVAEIKIRAERKAGELLGEMEKNKGGRPLENLSQAATGFSETPTLPDLGITRSQSSRFQQIASLPAEKFEALFGDMQVWLGVLNTPEHRQKADGFQARKETAQAGQTPQNRRQWIERCDTPHT